LPPRGRAGRSTKWWDDGFVVGSQTTRNSTLQRLSPSGRGPDQCEPEFCAPFTLHTYSNLDKRAAGAYVFNGGFGLGAYAGRVIRIQFRVVTDAVNVTALRIDDVSLR